MYGFLWQELSSSGTRTVIVYVKRRRLDLQAHDS